MNIDSTPLVIHLLKELSAFAETFEQLDVAGHEWTVAQAEWFQRCLISMDSTLCRMRLYVKNSSGQFPVGVATKDTTIDDFSELVRGHENISFTFTPSSEIKDR